MKSHPLPTLTPLDQLLINLRHTNNADNVGSPEWRFFLGFTAASELVVSDAKGAVSKVRWENVDSVAKRSVVIVRALTLQAYSERQEPRRLKESHEPAWLPATVLMAVLDPVMQRIDGFHIRQLNGEELMRAGPDMLHVDDYVRLVQMALDGVMPVLKPVPSIPMYIEPEQHKPLVRPTADRKSVV